MFFSRALHQPHSQLKAALVSLSPKKGRKREREEEGDFSRLATMKKKYDHIFHGLKKFVLSLSVSVVSVLASIASSSSSTVDSAAALAQEGEIL